MRHKNRKSLISPILGLLALFATPALANYVTGGTVGPSCTSSSSGYTISFTTADLVVGDSYSITWSISGLGPTTINNSVTFTATSSTESIGPLTEPITPTLSGSFTPSASATLIGNTQGVTWNTITTTSSPYFLTFSPSSLTCPVIKLACAAGSGQVGLSYDSNLVASGGVAPYTFSVTAGALPSGLTLNPTSGAITGTATASGSFNFTAQVVDSSGNAAAGTVTDKCGITIAPGPPPPTCTTGPQSITYNLHEQSQNASEIVWFNSHFKLQGTLPTSDFTVQVVNGTIQFGSSTLAVPNATITFSSSATCASTKFDTAANQWETTIPLSAAGKVDEIFAAGLAYVLPASFPQNIQGVTWTADFTASVPSLQIQWQWGAANYLSSDNKGDVFPMSGGAPDYNAMMIDSGHNVTTCANYNGGDHAGTPENATVKALVTGGGSGGGGSNWTGSWSSTQSPVCKQ